MIWVHYLKRLHQLLQARALFRRKKAGMEVAAVSIVVRIIRMRFLRLLLLAGGDKVVSTFLHGPQDVFVIRVQVMVETKEVKLGVASLLSFQHYLELSPLLTHEVGCPLNDVVGLDGCRQFHIRRDSKPSGSNKWFFTLFRLCLFRFLVCILLLSGLRGVIVVGAVFEGHCIVRAFISQSLTQTFVLLLLSSLFFQQVSVQSQVSLLIAQRLNPGLFL